MSLLLRFTAKQAVDVRLSCQEVLDERKAVIRIRGRKTRRRRNGYGQIERHGFISSNGRVKLDALELKQVTVDSSARSCTFANLRVRDPHKPAVGRSRGSLDTIRLTSGSGLTPEGLGRSSGIIDNERISEGHSVSE